MPNNMIFEGFLNQENLDFRYYKQQNLPSQKGHSPHEGVSFTPIAQSKPINSRDKQT